MLIVSIILFLLVIIIAIIMNKKPEYISIGKKALIILVILAIINFVLSIMGVL